MATEAQNLQQALLNISQQLADLTASPKPTYQVGGRNFSWTEHFTALCQQRDAIQKALVAALGPAEIRSQGV